MHLRTILFVTIVSSILALSFATTKPYAGGLSTRDGLPQSAYQPHMSAVDFQFSWSDLQPQSSSQWVPDVINRAISSLPSSYNGLRIRIYTGGFETSKGVGSGSGSAPSWVFDLGGARGSGANAFHVSIDSDQDSHTPTVDWTVPKLWGTQYLNAVKQLIDKLATSYDNHPKVLEFALMGVGVQYNEYATKRVPANSNEWTAAGYTELADRKAIFTLIDYHFQKFVHTNVLVWHNEPKSGLHDGTVTSQYPQYGGPDRAKSNAQGDFTGWNDLEFVQKVVHKVRSYGRRGINGVNNFKHGDRSAQHLAIQRYVSAAGAPINIQTYRSLSPSEARLTYADAVAFGANVLEVEGGYRTNWPNPSDMDQYNRGLVNNAHRSAVSAAETDGSASRSSNHVQAWYVVVPVVVVCVLGALVLSAILIHNRTSARNQAALRASLIATPQVDA